MPMQEPCGNAFSGECNTLTNLFRVIIHRCGPGIYNDPERLAAAYGAACHSLPMPEHRQEAVKRALAFGASLLLAPEGQDRTASDAVDALTALHCVNETDAQLIIQALVRGAAPPSIPGNVLLVRALMAGSPTIRASVGDLSFSFLEMCLNAAMGERDAALKILDAVTDLSRGYGLMLSGLRDLFQWLYDCYIQLDPADRMGEITGALHRMLASVCLQLPDGFAEPAAIAKQRLDRFLTAISGLDNKCCGSILGLFKYCSQELLSLAADQLAEAHESTRVKLACLSQAEAAEIYAILSSGDTQRG